MKQLPANSSPEKKRTVCYGKYLYAAFLFFTLIAANGPAGACFQYVGQGQ